MKRRDFITQLAGGLALAGMSWARTTAHIRPARPNVVPVQRRAPVAIHVVHGDARGPHACYGGYGGPGAEFTHAISNYPVCSPHRAILMTRRWPYQQGIIDKQHRPRPRTAHLGKVFQARYRTGYISANGTGGTRAETVRV